MKLRKILVRRNLKYLLAVFGDLLTVLKDVDKVEDSLWWEADA